MTGVQTCALPILYRESNPYISARVFRPEPEPLPSAGPTLTGEDAADIIPVNSDALGQSAGAEEDEKLSLYQFVMISLFFILAMLLIIVAFQYAAYKKRKRRRLYRRKETGDIWNQQK